MDGSLTELQAIPLSDKRFPTRIVGTLPTGSVNESECIFSEMLEPFVMLLTWNKEEGKS